jgi:hypothetical protein
MHSRIAKVLILGALMLALPMIATAQTSRVEGMSIQGDYIKDYTGIYTYTSSVTNVGNLVYGELGVATGGTPLDRSVGAVLGNLWDGRAGTWAIHMRQFTPQIGQGDATSPPAPGDLGGDPNFNSNEQFDIMWGKKFGTTSIGLRLDKSSGELELDNDPLGFGNISDLKFDINQVFGDPNLARNAIGFGAGVGWEMSPTTNIEANIMYQSRSFEISDTNGVTIASDNGKTAYQIAARAWWQWEPNVMVVPVFKWYSYDLSTAAGATTFDNTLKGGSSARPATGRLAPTICFLGFTLAQNKIEQEADVFGLSGSPGFPATVTNADITESFTPQIFAALETHVNSWLTLRFSQQGRLAPGRDRRQGLDAGQRHGPRFPFNMSLGAGELGTLQLDAIMNDAFPHNGLNFISGNTTSPLFPKGHRDLLVLDRGISTKRVGSASSPRAFGVGASATNPEFLRSWQGNRSRPNELTLTCSCFWSYRRLHSGHPQHSKPGRHSLPPLGEKEGFKLDMDEIVSPLWFSPATAGHYRVSSIGRALASFITKGEQRACFAKLTGQSFWLPVWSFPLLVLLGRRRHHRQAQRQSHRR